MHYLVAYLTTEGAYQSKIVSSSTPLNAICRTIPEFKKLIDNVVATVGAVDYDVVNYNLNRISIATYHCIEVDDYVKDIANKAQVVAIDYLDGDNHTLHLTVVNCKTKLDALFHVTETLNLPCNPDVLQEDWRGTDLNYVMHNIPYDNNWQVLEVNTLKHLIRATIDRA